jgi:hypothetical protein
VKEVSAHGRVSTGHGQKALASATSHIVLPILGHVELRHRQKASLRSRSQLAELGKDQFLIPWSPSPSHSIKIIWEVNLTKEMNQVLGTGFQFP